MQKENVLFLVSMHNTMKNLWPAPIEMGVLDEVNLTTKGQKNSIINASRWAVCSDIISLMITEMSGCGINVSIGKCTNTGTTVIDGDSEDKFERLLNVVDSISRTTKASEESNIEFAIREIDGISNSECKNKAVHWFIDTDMFVNLDSTLVGRCFPEKLVTLYVIGELRTLHENHASAKRMTILLEKSGIEIYFLLCRADLYELRHDVLTEKPYETIEKTVKCRIGKKRIQMKLLQKNRFGRQGWPIKKLLFVGFLPTSELCRLGFSSYKSSPERQIPISVDSDFDNTLLWTMHNHMLSDFKNQSVVLLKYSGSEKKEKRSARGFCIMVSHEEEDNGTLFTLIRLPEAINTALKCSLQYVNGIDEPKVPLPDSTYNPIAPEEHRIIKRHLMDIETLETPALKRARLEQVANEYNFLGAREVFLKFAVPVLKHNEAMRTGDSVDGNNN